MLSKLWYLIKFVFLSAFAVFITFLAFYTSFVRESGDLEVTFLYVGQGDCAYIKTPNGHRFFIDGGETGSYDEYIKPFLGKRRVGSINAAFVSHFHSDHSGGIAELLENKRVDALLVPITSERTTLIEDKLSDVCKNVGTKFIKCDASTFSYSEDSGLEIKAFFPDMTLYKNEGDTYNENNDSLVLRLKYAGRSFLFTGDLEKEAEDMLLQNYNETADVLKVAHHGSASSTSEAFLEAVKHEYAVISCGAYNMYNLPHTDVSERLEKCCKQVFRTDLNGSITFIVDQMGAIKLKCEQ